jgi:acetoin utilization protein AcuB
MKVRDCSEKITPGADLCAPDTSIDEVIRIVSKNPAVRSVYVVNEDGRLLGAIGMREILDILGAKFLRKRSIGVLHEILAKTAADIMRDPESVAPDDALERALEIAVVHKLEDLPVVENDRVVGNLDCFELIKGIMEER